MMAVRHPEQLRRRRKREYSKIVIAAIIVLWFVGTVYGGVIVAAQVISGGYTVSLDGLLTYIGAPMTGGIVGYLIKSAMENREKIKISDVQAPDSYYGGSII